MGEVYSSREIIQRLKAEGWYEVEGRGDHMNFKHPTRPGKVTVPTKRKDLNKKTANSIFKQAGWK